jgi:hypothetical protein
MDSAVCADGMQRSGQCRYLHRLRPPLALSVLVVAEPLDHRCP